jgi:hypothetical protein
MSHSKCHTCNKKRCPCTKEIAAIVPSSAEASKVAILPTVNYLHEIPADLNDSSNFTFATNLSGVLTIEGSFINLDLGPYSLSNPNNIALHIKNSNNISIFRGAIMGDVIVENSCNINFLYTNLKGSLIINDSNLCRIRDSTLESTDTTLQINNCKTCKVLNATICGKIICQNSSTINFGEIILVLNNPESGFYMNNVILAHIIDVMINGHNIASKGLEFKNCDNLIIKFINSENIIQTHVEFDHVTNSIFQSGLISGNESTISNGLITTNCRNISISATQFSDLKGDAISLTNCKAGIYDKNNIMACGQGIVVNGNGATVRNNTITNCKFGLVNGKKACNVFLSNTCSFSEEHNYRHVPHITISGENSDSCELNNIGSLVNISIVC